MTSLSETLMASLGNETLADPTQLPGYTVDGILPKAVLSPNGVEAVSQALSLACKGGYKVTPWGGGTQMALGNVPKRVDLVLGLGRLNHMLFHEPGDLVASVEAGMSLATLQEELATKGQWLPLEAPLPSKATIGGILAANASGPSRLSYGTARDWLIGINVVHADGTVTKAGGRVVKNVTGYDLNKLYVGSLGTLGVIVEATFKVAPQPHTTATLMATFQSMSAALESAQELLNQSTMPNALQVVNSEAMSSLPGSTVTRNAGAGLLALFSGREKAVKRRSDDAARAIKVKTAITAESLAQEEGDALWQSLTDLGWDRQASPALMATVSTVPSHVSDVLPAIDSLSGSGPTPGIVADVGSGLVRVLWGRQGDSLPTSQTIQEIIKGLREAAQRLGGYVIIEKCPLDIKPTLDVWGDSFEGMDIMRRIKQELDPARILNPGRYVGRL